MNRDIEVQEYLEELVWEHAWAESYYKTGEIHTCGIPTNDNYSGIARYCRCFNCRPEHYGSLKKEIEIFNKKSKKNDVE